MDTPFFDRMAAVARRGPRFFIPGHKGNKAAIPAFGPFLQYDMTEVDDACDLSHPAGPLAESETNMARAYGSGATLYSASGSTSCIMAMLALFCGAGGRAVMVRGCHVSAVRALAFLDATPHWVAPQNGRVLPADVDAALAASGAKTVYLTSPDYYGQIQDIAAIAAVCQKHGAALLVDNAHGAHLRFLKAPGAPRHPLAQGADATADSAHKTLPCLTPAALLHLKDAALAEQARKTLNLFCSTSPAYPVLLSLDTAAGLLLNDAPGFDAAAESLAAAGAAFEAVVWPTDDPLKLCLRPRQAGVAADAFHKALLAEGIAAEYYDGEVLVLMASPCNTEADFAALAAALEKLKKNLPTAEAPLPKETPLAAYDALGLPPPEVAQSPREALFAESETLPAAASPGRVMAGLSAPCPPGVPLVLPGEVITKAHAARLAAGGISAVDVVK